MTGAGWPLSSDIATLARFQEKWIPLFHPKVRKNNSLGSGFDFIKPEPKAQIL